VQRRQHSAGHGGNHASGAARGQRQSGNHRLPEADHAFNADYRASYHEESAKDGWQRMLAWFAQYGGKRA
jgi:dienelactone hydrolase